MALITTEERIMIEKELNHLKLIFECPRLYLGDYFADLKSQIDMLFARKEILQVNEKIKANINYNWNQMINKISSFETECFKNRSHNSFEAKLTEDIKEKLHSIDNQLKSDIVKSEDIRNEIVGALFRLKQNVFLNKSMLFMDNSKHETNHFMNKLDANTTVGKLLFITNDYLDENKFEQLFSNTDCRAELTNYGIKFKEIVPILEAKLEETYIEIELNIQEIDLDSKKLDMIQPDLFSGLTQCINIYLSSNRLEC